MPTSDPVGVGGRERAASCTRCFSSVYFSFSFCLLQNLKMVLTFQRQPSAPSFQLKRVTCSKPWQVPGQTWHLRQVQKILSLKKHYHSFPSFFPSGFAPIQLQFNITTLEQVMTSFHIVIQLIQLGVWDHCISWDVVGVHFICHTQTHILSSHIFIHSFICLFIRFLTRPSSNGLRMGHN